MQKHPVLITVDPGSTHMGRLTYAKELVRVAAGAGADVIKFQLFRGPQYTESGNIELNRDWVMELAGVARERRIMFTCSVFDREAVDVLNKVSSVPYIKLAHSMRDSDMIPGLLNIGKTIVVSTNKMDLGKLDPHPRLFTLFCQPIYPTMHKTNFEDVFTSGWGREVEPRKRFDGLSDHSLGYRESVRAVEHGARLLEKHLTLSYNDVTCPDAQFALTPKQLEQYVMEVRRVSSVWPKGVPLGEQP